MHGSAVARWVGLWVRTPPESWMSLVSVVCNQVEVSASGSSLVQRSSTYCEVSECDCVASIMRRPWPVRSVAPWGGEGDTALSSNSSVTKYFLILPGLRMSDVTLPPNAAVRRNVPRTDTPSALPSFRGQQYDIRTASCRSMHYLHR
jgi:hypothetical protein